MRTLDFSVGGGMSILFYSKSMLFLPAALEPGRRV